MQVETYECSETASEPLEASEEAVSLIESLNLAGQLEMIRPDDKSGRETRSPYRRMTADEQFVYQLNCPIETPVEKYSASPIPLRVLQVLAHAKSIGMFKRFVVWDRESAAVPDPVLIGYAPSGEYTWLDHRFILARWGEELETFSVLLKRAITTKREHLRDSLKRAGSQLAAETARVEAMDDSEIIAAGATAKFTCELRS